MQVKKIPFILIKMFRLGIDPTYKLKLSFDDWIEYVEKYLALALNDVKQFTSPQKIVFLHNDFEGDIIDFENELFNKKSLVTGEFIPSTDCWSKGTFKGKEINFEVQLDDLWFPTKNGKTVLGSNTDLSLVIPYLNLDLNGLKGRVGYKEGYCVRYEDIKKLPILFN